MMPLSRRRFLGMVTSLPLAVPKSPKGSEPTPPLDLEPPRCLLLDAGESCVLRESLTGFGRGLAAASIRFEQVSADAARPAQLMIVPGTILQSTALARSIRHLTDCGSSVLYESGAAYAQPEAFESERRLLRSYFGLSLRDPRELWRVKPPIDRAPYVAYRWPLQVMIRDFSRVISVSGKAASSLDIGHMGTVVVACRQPLGEGAFIYLGSPLGPHVGFGDADAQLLLEALIRSSEPI